MVNPKLRNIAIIAHVDHGKTTLVDQLLRQAGTFRSNQVVAERMMDSMDLERERGITIKAKNASFEYKDIRVNIVDTPGHADFGGEVERILRMIDGVLLVVDAAEGPQAQTKFVLRKALEVGAKPIVVLNKIDRENADPKKVLDQVFDLFIELHATDAQLDFPAVYASAKEGYATIKWDGKVTPEIKAGGMTALFDTILSVVPPPQADLEAPFALLVANLDHSDFVGRISIGRIASGSIKMGDPVASLNPEGKPETGRVTKLFSHRGMERIEIESASAGDIVGLAGLASPEISTTIADKPDRAPLPFVAIDPPTIHMQFLVNDSPLAGREGKFLTARHLRERLEKEIRTNVSLRFADGANAGSFEVRARGEMQIAILLEQMRREGFEVLVSRPEVIFQKASDGSVLEPIETLYAEIPSFALGDIMGNLAGRKAEIEDMKPNGDNTSLVAAIPTRGLIGFETDLQNLTKGMGIISHLFREYGAFRGEIPSRINGVLIALEAGTSMAYSLDNLQERGTLFVGPQEDIYAGMIVGENTRPADLTNMRSQGDGKGITLTPPLKHSLERGLEYLSEDEYLEVTPKTLRFRKKILDHTKRKRSE
jgi:GTP-binding protein